MNDTSQSRYATTRTGHGRFSAMLRRMAGLICALLAAVTSVDISASAQELIAARGLTDLCVSDAYRY